MNQAPQGDVRLRLIGEAAVLVSSGLLLIAASILFVGTQVSSDRFFGLIAGLGALVFAVWGIGMMRYVLKRWRDLEAAAQKDRLADLPPVRNDSTLPYGFSMERSDPPASPEPH